MCKEERKTCDAKGQTGNKHESAVRQQICPVMGEAIDKFQFTDYRGKRVYFCCGACKEKFLKTPDLYMKKLQ